MNSDLYPIAHWLKEKEQTEIQQYSLTVHDLQSSELYTGSLIDHQLYLYLLITQGTGVFEINNKHYAVEKNSFAILAPIHLFKITSMSEDFEAKVLLTYKSILDITPSMEKVFRQLNRSLKIYQNPLLQLTAEESQRICENMGTIRKRLSQTGHYLQMEVIQNAFVTFSLDWIDIWHTYHPVFSPQKEEARYEEIFSDFIKLLRIHYKEQHHVQFYASALSLTAHHLNLVIKYITGHTVSTLIYELLYCKACILLNQTTCSIEEIADELNFSDASAFCKFFRKRAHTTPLKYRKTLQK